MNVTEDLEKLNYQAVLLHFIMLCQSAKVAFRVEKVYRLVIQFDEYSVVISPNQSVETLQLIANRLIRIAQVIN